MNLHRQVGTVLLHPIHLLARILRWSWRLQARERHRLTLELHNISGLMPLLMKQRNGYRWTESDIQQIKNQLRILFALCPYLALILLPGGFFILPLLAWWLDRRRLKRNQPNPNQELAHTEQPAATESVRD